MAQVAGLLVTSGKSSLHNSGPAFWYSNLPSFEACKCRAALAAEAAIPLALLSSMVRRGLRKRKVSRNCTAHRMHMHVHASSYGNIPRTLYEFLGVDHRADTTTIRKAYLAKQKVFHPDVAGAEAQEVSVLLNSAFDLLRDREKRSMYDASLQRDMENLENHEEAECNDPVWPWIPKIRQTKPVYCGHPRSRSLWDRVPLEDRGEKWEQQKFLFVDELRCISCCRCIECAPRTFCMDADDDRARVYAQWGESEDDLHWAQASCPVACISWVSRQELQVLEHVTAEHMYETTPCRFAKKNATLMPRLAAKWVAKRRAEVELAKQRRQVAMECMGSSTMEFHKQLAEAIARLSPGLREAGGWC
ncbi:DJC76 [Symbiodinium natans]|uniref:DJC76 protein n=1 Tax=Symbiodinium natans TaxID=878477 RepID=A0A812QBU5_9DINO|nr:DJC76 [Symbiodinium natans]